MRHYHRKKLDRMLGIAGNEEFMQLLWAANALQTDYHGAARPYLLPDTIPEGAITTDGRSEYFIQKWEIETLANELMTTPKVLGKTKGGIRRLRCDHYQSLVGCVNRLRQLENAEYDVQKKSKDVLVEMGRIAARQFDWQRGFSMPHNSTETPTSTGKVYVRITLRNDRAFPWIASRTLASCYLSLSPSNPLFPLMKFYGGVRRYTRGS